MAELHCRHLRLPGEPGFWCFHLDEQGVVRDVRPEPSHAVEGRQPRHWDWQGDWLSPAAVDLQINGLQGLWFGHLEAEQLDPLRQALVWLRQQGVDAVCPTLITGPPARLRRSLALLRRVRQQQGVAEARLLGAHLEGPFLAVNKRGAHPRRHVQPLTLAHLKRLMAGFSTEDVALVTMAPELDPRHEALDWLVEQGIVVALGHTEANQTQATAAFAAGARLLTHTFNAMPPLHHRAPGPVAAAALASEPVFLGLIADGVHVAPAVAVLLTRMAPGRVMLVSDALAPYGLAEGRYPWGRRWITVQQGTCRLEGGAMAGTTVGILEGACRLARWSRQPDEAILAATVRPRACLGHGATVVQHLQGTALSRLLRWRWQPEAARLGWATPQPRA
ncbi:MAG: N-acetylglucosamine-6-phosphate deacetylase [Synechococcus sp. SB0666_bin_14]|nr:N-acetylglucosamine-6-phosphate deacetylase [Synechococcus sp. SB0666_bin_14]MYA91371.1 N-acetylglucosamine-6-phosphate deacetylase [Synechococcus sp. SB0663_bin_10]MYG46649.1 N-acetylglucosamine-6-phosphate deacetylase [Synechococcus sp. SB0675_bin_6]MYJ60633.1 N-acetylglucosamine-6-phosphate deacetylase [Synechococcus sp. SB0672_bin_6]MYK91125.1 N-acetylglucosamine-6-phosphate deacetylase [Synechococcus sp. SB0669_bin_8]